MLLKTRGIALNYIRYKETSIIAKIYTESFGLASYIVNGVRSKKARHKVAFFQPLTPLDLVVYHKKSSSLNRISELKCPEPLMDLPVKIKKSSIAIFITEVLIKSLKGEDENQALFNFMYQSILVLEHMAGRYENFHLQFMLKLSRFLGFAPANAHEIASQVTVAGSKVFMTDEDEEAINIFMAEGYTNTAKISNSARRRILDLVLAFYEIHVDAFGEVRSVAVLNEVLS